MKNPPRGPGIATDPHPAINVKSRGPKSRAGFSVAPVSGATTQMMIETARPIIRPKSTLAGFSPSCSCVIAKTKKARNAVPRPSASIACPCETHAKAPASAPTMLGFGK